jgi:DNA-binding HxlR family transcriptional regulator
MYSEPATCPVEITLRFIGGKWKPLILFYLSQQTQRFNDLRRLMPQITPQMLTQQLRALEQDGLIHRHCYMQIPPKVEYSLTPSGESLRPLLDHMVDWGASWQYQQRASRSPDDNEERRSGFPKNQ